MYAIKTSLIIGAGLLGYLSPLYASDPSPAVTDLAPHYAYRITPKPADSTNYNRRISGIVMHFTNLPEQDSLETLQKGGVSAHYLIPTKPKKNIAGWQLVDENNRAWHAGKSFWQGRTNLNDTTLGIEVVNKGFGFKQKDGSVLYYYDAELKVKAQLMQALKKDKSFLRQLKQNHLLDTFFKRYGAGGCA